jgi:hypothetical protein
VSDTILCKERHIYHFKLGKDKIINWKAIRSSRKMARYKIHPLAFAAAVYKYRS